MVLLPVLFSRRKNTFTVHRATTTKKNQETYQQRLDDWENKTGIFSDDTIVAQKDNKKTLTMNNFSPIIITEREIRIRAIPTTNQSYIMGWHEIIM